MPEIKGENKLIRHMAITQVYEDKIIKEQESIAESATKRIKSINRKMKVFQFRLRPYVKDKILDDNYYDLKQNYENLLVERATLQRTITVAQESIEAAKLHTIE